MHANLKALALNHGGFCTFDYNQANQPDFPALAAVHGAQARPGLCGALVIIWLDGFRNHRNLRAFSPYVNTDANGRLSVVMYTNQYCNAAAGWQATVTNIMNNLGFAHAASPFPVNLANVLAATQYGILVAYNAIASHAMGVRVVGNAVFFFDPNEGEVYFSSQANFVTWMNSAIGFGARHLGAYPNYMMMQYT